MAVVDDKDADAWKDYTEDYIEIDGERYVPVLLGEACK
jgi:hypothetical protein